MALTDSEILQGHPEPTRGQCGGRVDSVILRGGGCIRIREATSKGYAEADIGDSVNLTMPKSKTRRGRVGKGVAQTLDTGCLQGVIVIVE